MDLRGFRAVVHIPYAWSNFALFENLQSGLPYLIPSRRMLLELAGTIDFFWSPPFWPGRLELSEWYAPAHDNLFTYFDSWDELAQLAQGDLAARRNTIARFCDAHTSSTLAQWSEIFDRVG